MLKFNRHFVYPTKFCFFKEFVIAEYKASSIQVLEGLTPVRKRPGMYIGSTGARGLYHLVWEIVDNSVDEAAAGYATKINVVLRKDGAIEISDDGRGIPVGIHPKTQKSTVETVLTVLHAGGKFDSKTYKVSGGLHGVGASVVNALSKKFEVWVHREGYVWYQSFQNGGKPDFSLRKTIPSTKTGTSIRFVPDPTIMEVVAPNFDHVSDRCKQLAYLNKKLTIVVTDEINNRAKTFCFQGGLLEYVRELNNAKTTIHPQIIHAEKTVHDVYVEVALQYTLGYTDNVLTYANNILTTEGGTHEKGFYDALVRQFNNYAREHKLFKDKDEKLLRDDVREGLAAVVSVKHPDPIFEGQTKAKLGNSEVRKITNQVLTESLEQFLSANPDQATQILKKALLAKSARFAASTAREATRKNVMFDGTGLPGKLADCASRNPQESELYVVEGDSAGGSAKMGRDREFQAILPLRGKVINAEKNREDKVFANAEITSLVTAIGTKVGADFDINLVRYYKIIIMTDADVDGAHISILLLTFFYRYLRKLVEFGLVYLAQPPLYRVQVNKKVTYLYSDQERDAHLAQLPPTAKPVVQQYKGLGEMDANQLWETTMNPASRKLKQVQIYDLAAADLTFSMLMGEVVAPRRAFIQENARFAKNVDY